MSFYSAFEFWWEQALTPSPSTLQLSLLPNFPCCIDGDQAMVLIQRTMGLLITSFGIYRDLVLFSLIQFSALWFFGYDIRVSSLSGLISEEYSLASVRASEQVVPPPIRDPYQVIPYTLLCFP